MSREETMRRLGAYPKLDARKEQLEGRVVLLSSEHYKGDDYARLFVVTGGFGCTPQIHGSAVFGFFLADGEKVRVERQEVTHVFDGMPAPEEAPTLCSTCGKPMDETGPNERTDAPSVARFGLFGAQWHGGC